MIPTLLAIQTLILLAILFLVWKMCKLQTSTVVEGTPTSPSTAVGDSGSAPTGLTAPEGMVRLYDLTGLKVGTRPEGHPDVEEARKIGWTVK